jgi:hypothetical protein
MSSAQQLNKLITRTNEWKAIVRVCESEVHRFTIINCSTAISRLAKARDFHECDMKTVEKVIKRIRLLLQSERLVIEARQMSTIAWALAKMRADVYLERETVCALELICERVEEHRGIFWEAGAQEISNLFWASAKITQRRAKDSSKNMKKNDLDGFSCVRMCLDGLQRMFARAMKNERGTFTNQGVSNVIWSLATVTYVVDKSKGVDGSSNKFIVAENECDVRIAIMEAIEMCCDVNNKQRSIFNAQEIANVSWAVAKLNELNSNNAFESKQIETILNCLKKALRVLVHKSAQFETRHVANIVQSFVKMDANDSEFWTELKALTRNVLPNCNPHELSMIMWAIGAVVADDDDESNVKFTHDVARQFAKTMRNNYHNNDSYKEDDVSSEKETNFGLLANALWAIARVPKLLELPGANDLVAEYCQILLESSSGTTMNGRDASTILWSLAKIGDVVGFKSIVDIFEHFAKKYFSSRSSSNSIDEERKLEFFEELIDARSFSMILWAFAFGFPDITTNTRAKNVFESAHAVLLKNRNDFISTFNARDVANLTEAFAKRVDTPKKILQIVANRAAELIESFNAQELLKFLGAFERAGGDAHAHEMLGKLLSSKRTIKLSFLELGENSSAIKLRSATPSNDDAKKAMRVDDSCSGFGRSNTGVALWEGSRVLSEWISRAKNINLAEFGSKDEAWLKFRDFDLKVLFGNGKVGVELGAGLGLPSIVASRLGARVIATDGAFFYDFQTICVCACVCVFRFLF